MCCLIDAVVTKPSGALVRGPLSWEGECPGVECTSRLTKDAVKVAKVDCDLSDYTTSPYAAIGNGRVHYSTTSALPPTLLSSARYHRDVAAYTPDALPAFYDRRDLMSPYERRSPASPTAPDNDYSAPVQLPRSRLQFVRTLGHGLFGDVS